MPEQSELPFAIVEGSPLMELPKDLYIPPQALEVFLEAFEGPLDLLLYLIRRQNLNVLDIPVAEITRQYMEYVEIMKELQLELAAEYLVMAAMLAEIKSRMLLPRPASAPDDENDPRAELVRRLQEYERYKQAAEGLDELPRVGRDIFEVSALAPHASADAVQPKVTLTEILFALRDVMQRAKMHSHHHVQLEPLSVRERMTNILAALGGEGAGERPGGQLPSGQFPSGQFVDFGTLFTPEEGKAGVVVTLLALLELLREGLVELTQARAFGPIHVRTGGVQQQAVEA